MRLDLGPLHRLVGVWIPLHYRFHAPEAALANVTRVKGLDECVVEVKPWVGARSLDSSLFDEGVVVARVRGAGVHEHTSQLVHAVTIITSSETVCRVR
eukprot:scaffold123396_cov30-Tisochrysis_lutea.AAC.8